VFFFFNGGWVNKTDQHLRDVWDQAQKAAESVIKLPEGPTVSGSEPVIVTPPGHIPSSDARPLPRSAPYRPTNYKPLLWTLSVIVIGIIVFAILLDQSRQGAQRQREFYELVERQRTEEEGKRKEAERKEEEERKAQEAEVRRLQMLEALKPAGYIEQVWVDHNVFDGARKGMLIHVRFRVKNYQNTQCSVNAYFYYASGERLNDFNNTYATPDGQVAMGMYFTPRDRETIFSDARLFMPYGELHLSPGNYDLKFDIELRTLSGDLIVESEYTSFSAAQQ
jgi:hypothetical protein